MRTAGRERGRRESDRRTFLVRTGLASFGDNMMAPYIGVYAVQMGATPAEMGWLSSLQNLSGNTMQFPWGTAMDQIGRPVLFVLLGGFIGGMLWLPLLFVSTPEQIIMIVFLQGLFMSMTGPSSLVVNDDLLPRSKRTQAVAEFHSAWMIGTIPAILLSGYLMSQTKDSLKAMYFTPIIMAAVFRAGSALLLWSMMTRERHEAARSNNRVLDNIGTIMQNPSLRIMYSISFFQGFFMSFAWPLFPIANVIITKNNMFYIALLSATSTIVSSLTRPYFGKLADRFGKRPIIMLGWAGMAIFPLSYVFATEPWHLLIANAFVGLFMMADSITQAYIIENSQPEWLGTSLSFYGVLYGIATFFGSLAGGYLVNSLLILGFKQANALAVGFLFSTAGRAASGLAYGKLRETRKP